MSGHTPGPWHVQDPFGDDAGDALWIVRDGATPEVYDWRCVAIATSDDPEETDNPMPVTAAERDVNARLIAAAPDLLEALELVVGSLRCDRQDDLNAEVLRRVSRAIARATSPESPAR